MAPHDGVDVHVGLYHGLCGISSIMESIEHNNPDCIFVPSGLL